MARPSKTTHAGASPAKRRAKRRKPAVHARAVVGASTPGAGLPAVPEGFVPVNVADFRGYSPLASQIAALPEAIAELQRFTDYAATFGIAAPDPGRLTRTLTTAAEWTTVDKQASAWLRYVQSRYTTAWKDALDEVKRLKVPFQLASEADPALLGRCPGLAQLLDATRVNAQRAADARARNRAAKQAGKQD